MSQLLNFRILFICSLLISTCTFFSCDKDTSISLESSGENFGVIMIDSMTINTSTYQLLNLPSAGTGTVLVGKSTQPNIGSITSSSYLSMILETLGNDIPNGATFQSVELVLRPTANRYYYGDTTNAQTITVHQVTEEIKTQNITTGFDNFNTPIYVTGPTIFSNQQFDYNPTALGTTNFYPNVRSLDSIAVPLDYTFGKNLFDKIVSNDISVSSHENFLQYLKGIAIIPNQSNTVLLGLSDTVRMNLNYTYVGSDGFSKTGTKSLVTAAKSLQFNNIEYDRTGTPYAPINNTNRELKSTATNGEVLFQAGSGLATKITIPSLNEFILQEDIAINKIELVIETNGNNYGFYPDPSSVMLLIENSNGVPISYVRTPFSNNIQSSRYIPSDEFGVNGKYVFNLIEYVKTINNTANLGTSLLLTSSSPSLFNTANAGFIATENGKPKIKLNIVYTKFQ